MSVCLQDDHHKSSAGPPGCGLNGCAVLHAGLGARLAVQDGRARLQPRHSGRGHQVHHRAVPAGVLAGALGQSRIQASPSLSITLSWYILVCWRKVVIGVLCWSTYAVAAVGIAGVQSPGRHLCLHQPVQLLSSLKGLVLECAHGLYWIGRHVIWHAWIHMHHSPGQP